MSKLLDHPINLKSFDEILKDPITLTKYSKNQTFMVNGSEYATFPEAEDAFNETKADTVCLVIRKR